MLTKVWATDPIKLAEMKALVRDVLLNPGSPWRSHGLGMIQFELSESLRIHIWDPRLCQFSEEETGHRHRFDMKSSVLWGSVNHIEVTPVPGSEYRKVCFHGSNKTGVSEEEGLWDLLKHPMHISAGQSYHMPFEAYHQFSVPEMAITLVTRSQLRGDSEAFFPVDSVPRPGRAEDGMGVDKELSLQVISEAQKLISIV